MKTYKELLNRVISQNKTLRKLNDTEIYLIKTTLLDMYKKLAAVCEQNNLCLMLSGGSVLGAVRHQGFIPWDDDLDLNMPRADYVKLLKMCEEGVLGDDLYFSYPDIKQDSHSAFLKIYSKKCQIVGLWGQIEGVHLDVFPIDGVPSNFILRRIKGYTSDILRLITNMVEESGKWSEEKKQFYAQDRYLYFFMRCRQLLGRVFSVIKYKRWLCLYDSFVKCETLGEFATIPAGRKLYNGETLPTTAFIPTSKGVFEGLEVNLPANSEAYLRNLYGDYMQIPPEEKRESHLVMKVEYCPNNDVSCQF